MKFAALLRHSAEDLPELSQLFRSYKQLKKRLKTLPQRCNAPAHHLSLHELSQREAVFVRAILQNVQGFNDTFLDREEDAVIQLRTLEDAQVAARPERVQVIFKCYQHVKTWRVPVFVFEGAAEQARVCILPALHSNMSSHLAVHVLHAPCSPRYPTLWRL